MPKVYPEAYAQDGIIIAPEEINHETTSLLGVFNGGMDRDNLDQVRVKASMVESGTFHEMRVIEQTAASQVLTFVGGTQPGQWVNIPDATGDPWVKRVTTEESVLDIVVSCDVGEPSFGAFASLGIRVNGIVVASTSRFGVRDQVTRQVEALVPVGAGTQVVDALVMPSFSLLSGSVAFTFLGRCFWVREVKR